MDYPCAKFGSFSFSRFGFTVRTDRITATDDRYTHVTTIRMSDNIGHSCDNCDNNSWLGGSVVEPANFYWSAPDLQLING